METLPAEAGGRGSMNGEVIGGRGEADVGGGANLRVATTLKGGTQKSRQ